MLRRTLLPTNQDSSVVESWAQDPEVVGSNLPVARVFILHIWIVMSENEVFRSSNHKISAGMT